MKLVIALLLLLVAILVAMFIAINRPASGDAVGRVLEQTPGSVHASG